MSQTATLILTHGQIHSTARTHWRKPWPSPMENSRPEATIES